MHWNVKRWMLGCGIANWTAGVVLENYLLFFAGVIFLVISCIESE